MARLIEAEGDWLERIRDARWHRRSEGLGRDAYGRWHLAQMKMAARHASQRTVALVEGAALLASAEHYDLTAVMDGRRVRACGMGALLGEAGSVRRLVDMLASRGENDGAELALLFPPDALLEPREREVAIRCPEHTLRIAESVRHGAPMTMVRGGEERDLPAIAAMGQRRAESFRFHLERDADFIRRAVARKRLLGGLGPMDARQLHFFIAEEGTTAAAYVMLSVIGNEWTLEECGDRDPSGARVGALLQALIARDPAGRRPVIRGWLPAGFVPPQATIVSSTPSSEVILVRGLGGIALPAAIFDHALYWRSDLL